jgi:hypothetical protein
MVEGRCSPPFSRFLDPPGLSRLGSVMGFVKGADSGVLEKIGVGDHPALVLPHPDHPAHLTRAVSAGRIFVVLCRQTFTRTVGS